MRAVRISVVIVTHNSEQFVDRAIHHLRAQTRPADLVVIVDSGSAKPDHLKKHEELSGYRVVYAQNLGFCGANNLGTAGLLEQSEYVLYLNPDAYLHRNFLEGAVAFMESAANSAVGCLTGTLLGFDNAKGEPTGRIDSTGLFRTAYGRWYDRDHAQPVARLQSRKGAESVPAICGALMFCRTAALKQVAQNGKPFDERFFMYKEDVDLSLRLRKVGWKLVYHPDLQSYHCRGWNARRSAVSRSLKLRSARNEVLLCWKHASPFLVWAIAKFVAVKFWNV